MYNIYFVNIVTDDAISEKRMQHFYLEVSNNANKTFYLKRKHNENEVNIWNSMEHIDSLLDSGVLEKYVQTD